MLAIICCRIELSSFAKGYRSIQVSLLPKGKVIFFLKTAFASNSNCICEGLADSYTGLSCNRNLKVPFIRLATERQHLTFHYNLRPHLKKDESKAFFNWATHKTLQCKQTLRNSKLYKLCSGKSKPNFNF